MDGKARKDFEKKIRAKLSTAREAIESEEDPAIISLLEKEVERLEKKLARLHAGKRLDELNASKEKYLQKNDKNTIKKAIKDVVPELYGDNQGAIFSALQIAHSLSDLHSRTAFDMYQNEYFCRMSAASGSYLRSRKSNLEKICNHLDHKPMSKINETDIDKLVKELKGDVKAKLKMAKDFFEYCGEVGAYTGENPFQKYVFRDKKAHKTGENASLYPKSVDFLEEGYDKRLHEQLVKKLNDGLGLAIPLVKGCGISASRIIGLAWKDIDVDGEEVRIQEYKDKFTGGTSNYVRPPTKETAELIMLKYNSLVSRYGKTKVKKMKVLQFDEGIAEDSKKKNAALTKYIRSILLEAGIPSELLKKAVNQENPKEAGGAGLNLLRNHYVHSLQEQGGVELDSGVGRYLRVQRIHDTTNDCYRCLSDKTGNHFLQIIMRRINTGGKALKEARVSSVLMKEKGQIKINLPARGHDIKTGVVTKKAIYIPKGSEICVCSPYGLEGTIKFHKEPRESKALEYKKIY